MNEIVYVGRGSYWGNPYLSKDRISKYANIFTLGVETPIVSVDSKKEAIQKFKEFLWQRMNEDPGLKTRLVETFLNASYRCPGCGINSLECHGKVLKDAAQWLANKQKKRG